jgi:phosphatidylglycerophosphate synthase
MRKLHPKYENPIDDVILNIIDGWCPTLKNLGFTPNVLTTISLVFGVLSVYYLSKDKFVIAAVLYSISYIFDCVDGHFARKYKMITKFGDYYDHISDVLVTIGLLYYIYKKCKPCVIPIILIGFLSTIHLGCQERLYPSNESPSLSQWKTWCPTDDTIHYTKYFGCGTAVMVIISVLMYLEYKKHNK